jgi:hypothetical protein
VTRVRTPISYRASVSPNDATTTVANDNRPVHPAVGDRDDHGLVGGEEYEASPA